MYLFWTSKAEYGSSFNDLLAVDKQWAVAIIKKSINKNIKKSTTVEGREMDLNSI